MFRELRFLMVHFACFLWHCQVIVIPIELVKRLVRQGLVLCDFTAIYDIFYSYHTTFSLSVR